MTFSNCEARLLWLQKASQKIWQMEDDRKIEIMNEDYKKAFSLHKVIKFARFEFAQVSNQIRKERLCRK